MIVNPFLQREKLKPIFGTRILADDFNLLRVHVTDPRQPNRTWRIVGVYAPLSARSASGLRVKVVDDNEVVTFIEQMQLEVLLELGAPNTRCGWSGKMYHDPEHQLFNAFVMDEDDLDDDLLDREHVMRASCANGVIPDGTYFTRRVRLEEGDEYEDLMSLSTDGDASINLRPDCRLETVSKRWMRIERKRYKWTPS